MAHEHPSERAAAPSRSENSGEATGLEHRRRHRALVWPLIVLASLLLVLSISANWIQAEALDTDWVVSATDEMLDTPEVRGAVAEVSQGTCHSRRRRDQATGVGPRAKGARIASSSGSRLEGRPARARAVRRAGLRPAGVPLEHGGRGHARLREGDRGPRRPPGRGLGDDLQGSRRRPETVGTRAAFGRAPDEDRVRARRAFTPPA